MSTPGADCIAVLNAGSSSIKFALYDAGDEGLLLHGQIENLGDAPHLMLRDAAGKTVSEHRWNAGELDYDAAVGEILRITGAALGDRKMAAVGHRVVHGGMKFVAPVRVDDGVLAELQKLVPLAPLHQPHNLAPIRAIMKQSPGLPQVACFDTAFHHGQAAVVREFAIPRALQSEGVRRYGFHGLSYEYITGELPRIAPDIARSKLVIAHLGNGASLCAVHEGRSIASTMGFTAVDGLVMGTRCGTIDPGVLVYMMDEHKLDARGIEDLIYRRSGLLGVSGISSDMRTLRESKAPEAAEAIALFTHRIIREIGSLAAAMGGLDGLVFTAGIGEHDAATRAEVAAGCAWLGLTLDPARNAKGDGRISNDGARVQAWVIPTDEERMIARHTGEVLGPT